jgi:hypothetical protein
MHPPRRRRLVALTLLFAGLAIAPAAPQEPARPSPLAVARYQAAEKQFEIIWSYYKQDRTDSFQVYVWSRLVLDARREMGETPADRRAALEGHLERMKRMEELVRKIRRLGFGRSSDVGATEYYRLEAEHWLARAGGEK